MVYLALGQNEAALADMNQVLEIDASDVDAYRRRSQIYRRMGNQAAAEADMALVKSMKK